MAPGRAHEPDDRILVLVHALPPMWAIEGVLCTKRMAGLRGMAVDIVTTQGHGPWAGSDRSLDSYVQATYDTVRRVDLPPLLRHVPLAQLRLLVRIPDEFRLLNGSMRRALCREDLRRYRAILTWSQFHSVHLVGLALSRRPHAPPWVAHLSDPWVANPFVRWGPVTRAINRRLERRVLDRADRVLVTSEETAELTSRPYGAALRRKLRVLPHSFDPDLYPPAPQRPRGERPLVVRYVGHFYEPRTPRPLFAALLRLLGDGDVRPGDVRVEIIGQVEEHLLRDPLLARLPREMVEVLPPVDYVESLALMVESDVLVLVDAPNELSPFLPSKLVDYIGAGRPVVALTPPGAAAGVVRDLGGWVADPSDPGQCAAALANGLHCAASAPAATFGDQGIRRRYENEAVGREMLEILHQVWR